MRLVMKSPIMRLLVNCSALSAQPCPSPSLESLLEVSSSSFLISYSSLGKARLGGFMWKQGYSILGLYSFLNRSGISKGSELHYEIKEQSLSSSLHPSISATLFFSPLSRWCTQWLQADRDWLQQYLMAEQSFSMSYSEEKRDRCLDWCSYSSCFMNYFMIQTQSRCTAIWFLRTYGRSWKAGKWEWEGGFEGILGLDMECVRE